MRRGGFSAIELLFALAIVGIVAVAALPALGPALSGARLSGDGRAIANEVSVAKLRAASYFTRARLYADLATNSYRIEVWRKEGTPGWVTEVGTQYLSRGVTFGFTGVGAPPPNTQPALAQADACLDSAGAAIGGSACVVFNSRGVPVDGTNMPIGNGALYITDGTAVYGTTVSATGLARLWWAPVRTGVWLKQQ